VELTAIGELFLRQAGSEAAFPQNLAEGNLESALGRHAVKGESRETRGLQTIVITPN